MRSMIALAGLSVVSLAACGQSGDAEKKTEGATAKATATAEAGLPAGPTPGLWRVTTQMSGMPAGAAAPTVETCIRDAKFERPDAPMAEMSGMDCQQEAFRREGDVIVGRSVCTMGEGMRSESNFRISGDFTRRYTMEVKSSMTPAPTPAMANTTMIMTAERLGDCPASAAQ